MRANDRVVLTEQFEDMHHIVYARGDRGIILNMNGSTVEVAINGYKAILPKRILRGDYE